MSQPSEYATRFVNIRSETLHKVQEMCRVATTGPVNRYITPEEIVLFENLWAATADILELSDLSETEQ